MKNLAIILVISISVLSCKKDEVDASSASNSSSSNLNTPVYVATAPLIGETTVSSITTSSAISTSKIINDGQSLVTERGVCYSINHDPSISDHKIVGGSGVGTFTSNISGLTANTFYFIKAYAINSTGITYGAEVKFKTNL